MIKLVDNIDREEVVWRYMDLFKFVSMLENNALFFTKASIFDDDFEGSLPKINHANRKHLYNEKYNRVSELNKALKEFTCVSCWHLDTHESEAMWKLYSDNKMGIAIKTTMGNLIDCFKAVEDDIYLAKVRYVDYENDYINIDEDRELYYYKRDIYESENEIRLVHSKNEDMVYGHFIECDLNKMINEVYVLGHDIEVIREAVLKGSYSFEVKSSILNKIPVF
ncbi:MAG: hypothetical protein N4A47_02180 [Clostridia bacterium]|jgi:hypothetical protein|nr:hypothetical protein [Clostridia bacterium]